MGDREIGKQMRIALLGSRGIPASYSGFETFYEQLATRLVQRGHEVTVYNRSHHVEFREPAYRGVRLVRMPSIPTKHLDTITHTLLSAVHATAGRYDVYYFCIVGNSPVCVLPQVFGKRTVLNVDGQDAARDKWRGAAKSYIRIAERIAASFVDVLVADSRVIARRYLADFDRETVFIPYGANVLPRNEPFERSGLLEHYGLEEDGYILFVSRLTPENGAHLLIEAFKQSRTDLRLVIVGDAPYVGDYKRHLEDLCDERIVLTGYLFCEQYKEISRCCRFFVLPSGVDGTRPVLLDQLGFGNCVLVKNTPANLEVIGDSGLSFDRDREVDSLRERIEALSQDPETIELYRARSLGRVQDEYSWDRVTDTYEELFRTLLVS